MANIPELWLKSKQLSEDLLAEWGTIALVVVTCLGAFGLGRLSALVEARPLVELRHAPEMAAPAALNLGGQLVASKYGSYYYYPWCSGAAKIAQANQRWFPDTASAEAAGYRPAKNCKGLE